LILDGDFSAESGVACTDQLIRSQQPFTAIVAANDITAFGARLSLYRHGISVPDQVSLIGFDDQMESAFTTPPLTTIRQPAREMGEQAARAVLAIINGDDITPDTVVGELIERESVSGSR
jgi:LacI family transcriptional regulator